MMGIGRELLTLNKVIKDDTYKTPRVIKIKGAIRTEVKFYCSLDLRQGYQYLSIGVEDHKKMTLCKERLTQRPQSPVLLYGKKNRGQVLLKAMDQVLSRMVGKCCLLFIGYICYTPTKY
jgi:hypothetical protein